MLPRVQFNAYKHHAGFLRQFVARVQVAKVAGALKVIGNSQMDLYFGDLTVEAVRKEVISHLNDDRISSVGGVARWVKRGGGYRQVVLSDGSTWIIRSGDEGNVHIHPGRYSRHTFRVTAAVLKTAVACAACLPRIGMPGVVEVNRVRKDILGLPPLRSVVKTRQLIDYLGLA